MGKIPWGGITFFAGVSVTAGLVFGAPLWLFGAYMAAWIALCAVLAWIGGECRDD